MGIFKKMIVLVLSFMIVITMGVGLTATSFADESSTGEAATSTETGAATDTAENNLTAASTVETSRVKFSTTQVKWNEVSNAEGYVVTARKKGSSKVTTQVVTDTDAAYTGLKPNSKYKYSVKAYKEANGDKKYSAVKSTSYVVSGYVKSTAKTSSSVSLRWSPITSASKYEVQVIRKGKTVKTKKVKSSKTCITGLSSKTKYRFKVVAYNSTNEATTAKSTTVTTRSNFIWPVRGSVLSGFGYRTGYGSSYHEGIDINASTGTAVKAAKAGKVIRAGWYYGYGKCVMVSHGNGVVTLYGHLSKIKVHNGQRVSQGQVIAKSGMTGSASCPHLHFEIQIYGHSKNPMYYLP